MPWIGKLDDNSIPLADDDPQVIINDDNDIKNNRINHHNNNNNHASSSMLSNGRSMDSLPSSYTNGSSSPGGGPNSLEPDISPDEQEDKARLISQVLELQNTLDDLSLRVDSVKEENLKLKSENLVLGQYIENLMSASSVFQSTSSPITNNSSNNNNNNNHTSNNNNNNNNNNHNHNHNNQSKKK